MRDAYVLAKDHLEQAQVILSVDDTESRHLRRALQVMIDLIDETLFRLPASGQKVIEFPGNRLRRSFTDKLR